jgi:hypothetical protein
MTNDDKKKKKSISLPPQWSSFYFSTLDAILFVQEPKMYSTILMLLVGPRSRRRKQGLIVCAKKASHTAPVINKNG